MLDIWSSLWCCSFGSIMEPIQSLSVSSTFFLWSQKEIIQLWHVLITEILLFFLVACLTLLPSFHNDSSYEQKKVHNLPKTVNPISMNKKISNNCYRYYSRRWFHCLLFCSWMFIRSCSSDICDCEKIAGFLEYWHFTKNRIWCRQLRNVTISTRQNENTRGGYLWGFLVR